MKNDDLPPIGQCIDPIQANEAKRDRIRDRYGDQNPRDDEFDKLMARWIARNGEVPVPDSRPPLNTGDKRVEVVSRSSGSSLKTFLDDAAAYLKKKGVTR